MQQFIVVSRPVRRADDYWEVTCRLIDNNYSSRIDLDDYEVGDTTRFQSNAMPELHEEGYVKYQSKRFAPCSPKLLELRFLIAGKSHVDNQQHNLDIINIFIKYLNYVQRLSHKRVHCSGKETQLKYIYKLMIQSNFTGDSKQ